MKNIKELMNEYKFSKEKMDKLLGFYAYDNYCEDMHNFFTEVKSLGKQMDGFGYNISIMTEIYNGTGNLCPFKLTLSHFADNRLYFIGDFVNDSKSQLIYTFDPETTQDFQKGDIVYLPVLSFVFVQIYQNKSYILRLFENAICDEIKKHNEFHKHLITYAKEIRENL